MELLYARRCLFLQILRQRLRPVERVRTRTRAQPVRVRDESEIHRSVHPKG